MLKQDPGQCPQTTQGQSTKEESQPTPASKSHLMQKVKVPARHLKLLRAKTIGLSFPTGSLPIWRCEIHELTGLVLEHVLIPAEK